jgi:hypothetical protein
MPYGTRTIPELQAIASATNGSHFLVSGLFPTRSVNLVCGDSGLGKTPWAYQLGLCVAAGQPFLGHAVHQGRVLYLDLENGDIEAAGLVTSMTAALNLSIAEDQFYQLPQEGEWTKLQNVISDLRPVLVIIDTLRMFYPEAAGKDNERAARAMSNLRDHARRYDTTFVVLHHLRKPVQDTHKVEIPSLEELPFMEWALQIAGARALVNQSEVRLGLDRCRSLDLALATTNSGSSALEEVALVMKGHRKVHGEFGPVYLKRTYDDEGNPIVYDLLRDPSLLANPHYIDAYRRLPPHFHYRQLKTILGRGDSSCVLFLNRCLSLHLLTVVKKGEYAKDSSI